MSNHETAMHDVVAVYHDIGDEYDHMCVVAEDGSIFKFSLYHAKMLTVEYSNQTRSNIHAGSHDAAELFARQLKDGTVSAETIITHQQRTNH